MLCVACGGDIPAGSRFCPRCGRATPVPEAPATPPGGYGGAPGGYAPPPPPTYGPPPGFGPPPGAYPPVAGYGATTGGPVAEGLASFGQRVGATVMDTFILWVVMSAGLLVAGATVPEVSFENPNPGPSGIGSLLMMITWLAAPAYFVLLEGRPDGQTIGKKAMAIRVVRKSNGAPMGYGLAVGRYLARFVDGITLGLGLLWAAWDPLHQTFHDKIAGTLVVRSQVYPPPTQAGSAPPGSR